MEPEAVTGPIHRFGEFELDEARFELRRAGAPVFLQPKAFDLLLHLVRHRDRVVTRAEIYAALWPGVVVTEDSLNKAVSSARRAVGDAGRKQRIIRTFRGRGLRFVASLDTVEHAIRPIRPPEDAGGPATGFVGRAEVLAVASEALAAARRGRGGILLITGEAGAGKTRTAQELALRVRRTGGRVLTGWCPEEAGSPSLWPWLRLLRPLLDRGDLAALARELGDGVIDLAERMPLRAGLAARTWTVPQDPAQARFRIFATVHELLARAAEDDVLFAVLDDFHCADADSLGLLEFLAHEISGSRVVLAIAYREDDLEPGHVLLEIARRPECRSITLSGLSPEEVAELVESELGVPIDAPAARAVHEQTGGNPFFAKELVRSLSRERRLEADAVIRAAASLPSAVRDVLRPSLVRLPAECREVLVLGALVGREFDLAVVARASGRTPARLLELLEMARATHVLEETGVVSRFSHALLREAVIETAPVAERARLHRRIGEALEAVHGSECVPRLAEMAHHFAAGAPSGGVEKALAYAHRAGDAAAARLACDEAAAHYGRALALQKLLASADERLRCELLIAQGEMQIGAGRPPEGRAALREAAEIGRRLGLAAQVARAALASGGLVLSTEVGVEDPALVALLDEALAALPQGPSSLRTRLLARLALALAWSGGLDRSRALTAEALAAGEQAGDPVALGQALYVHRWSLLGPKDLPGRLAVSDRMLELALAAKERELELAARSCRFLDLLEAARLPAAARELAVYERIASEFGVPRYRWRARFYRVTCLLLEGRFAEAEERAVRILAEERRFGPRDAGLVFATQIATLRYEQERLGEIAPALGDLADRFPTMPIWSSVLALALAEAGREAEARAVFEVSAASGFNNVPRYFGRLMTLAVLADVCSVLGDRARAEQLYALLGPYSPRTVVVGAGAACWGSVDLFIGRLARTLGDSERAVRHFEAARKMNARIGARPFLAWSEYELARARASGADARGGAEVAASLGRAREIAAALGMKRLSRHADTFAATFAASS